MAEQNPQEEQKQTPKNEHQQHPLTPEEALKKEDVPGVDGTAVTVNLKEELKEENPNTQDEAGPAIIEDNAGSNSVQEDGGISNPTVPVSSEVTPDTQANSEEKSTSPETPKFNLVKPETTEDLNNLAQYIYQGNKAKGFWPEESSRDKAEAWALGIGELYESLEAHRKNRFADYAGYKAAINAASESKHSLERQLDKNAAFDMFIKDTVGDELADAVIRFMDFFAGFEFTFTEENRAALGTMHSTNYGRAILNLTRRALHVFHEIEDMHFVDKVAITSYGSELIHNIVSLGQQNGLDVWAHVLVKLEYNANRPHKHGKTY